MRGGGGGEITLDQGSAVTRALPLRREPAFCISPLWALLAVAGVAYGSLLPFQLNLNALTGSNFFGLLNIRFHGAPLDDVLTNVAVYFPIGLFLSLGISGPSVLRRPRHRVFISVLVGGMVSLAAEALQSAMPERVASWTDVLLNIFGCAWGAGVGALIAGRGAVWLDRWHRFSAERPFHAVAMALTIGLVLFELAPFDFVATTGQMHEAFRRAIWHPLQNNVGTQLSSNGGNLLGELGMAAWFAVLGYVFVLGELERSNRSYAAFVLAGLHCTAVAGLIELGQLFTASHVFISTTVILRGLAGVFGAWAAAFVLDPLSAGLWRGRPRVALPTGVILLLAALQTVILVGPAVGSGVLWNFVHAEVWLSWRTPFEALWRGSMLRAASDVLTAVTVFGTFAFLIGVCLRRRRLRPAWPLAGLATFGLAVMAAAADAVAAHQPLDATPPILAALAALAVAQTYPRLRPAYIHPMN